MPTDPSRPLAAIAAAALALAAAHAAAGGPPIDCDGNGIPDDSEIYDAPLLTADFESGLPLGWGATGLWSVTDLCAAPLGPCDPGSTSWAYLGQTASCDFDTGAAVSGVLTSPVLNVPADAAEITLTYCSRYAGEGGEYPGGIDSAAVVIEAGGGAIFDLIDDVAGSSNAFDQWERRSVKITGFAGQDIRLRFEFDSQDEVSNDFLGWQIDDVALTYSTTSDCDGNNIPDDCELTTVFRSDDFEGGNFPADAVATGIWSVTSQCAGPGGECDNGAFWTYFGVPGPAGPPDCTFDTGFSEAGQLGIGPFTLPDRPRITLRYCSRYQGEADPWTEDLSGFDTAATFVLSDVDNPPGVVTLVDNVSADAGNGVDTGWTVREADLSAFAGQEILLFFDFNSNDDFNNDFLGWQIDNIEIITNSDNDCNGNGVHDACELEAQPGLDCDGNGVLDSCELLSDPDADRNSNGVIDECESIVWNETDNAFFTSVADAVNDPQFDPGDTLRASTPAREFIQFPENAEINRLRNWTGSPVDLPPGGLWSLADGLTLGSSESFGFLVRGGQLDLSTSDTTYVNGDITILDQGALSMGPNSLLEGPSSFELDLDSGNATILGGVFSGVTFYVGQGGPTPEPNATLRGFGIFDSRVNVRPDGEMVVQADTQVLRDLSVSGRVIVQSGTLTVFDSLFINGGEIIGDVVNPTLNPEADRYAERAEGHGLFINGNLTLSPDSALAMPDPASVLRAGADADLAIDDHNAFDMASAELRMVGVDGPQNLEVMSLDLGPNDRSAFDRALPGRYPIGTLRIGPTATTVDLVDTHDNDAQGQAACEAIYAQTLVIEPGATLNTNGCRVYARTIINNGSVDDPSNLVPAPDCKADFNGDGATDIFDFGILADFFGLDGATFEQGDATGDGKVNTFDFGELADDFGCGL
jgi:hypothetical protein